MVEIGQSLRDAEENKKPQKAFETILEKRTIETIPSSEEMMSIASGDIQNIKEYIEYRRIPDVFLEKEQCWPVDPDLRY
jgi:predicted RNA binding protein with dsRBD fold (UPF0201 family)